MEIVIVTKRVVLFVGLVQQLLCVTEKHFCDKCGKAHKLHESNKVSDFLLSFVFATEFNFYVTIT